MKNLPAHTYTGR